MKLGMEFPQKWKEKSSKDNIALADILYGYAIENLMLRIEQSSFQEYLWLTNEYILGEEAYKKNAKERLEFIYVESEKKTIAESLGAGGSFSLELMELLCDELFQKQQVYSKTEFGELQWDAKTRQMEDGIELFLVCSFMDIQVPVTMSIAFNKMELQKPKRKEFDLMFDSKKACSFLSYSKESALSESVFEMMRKLELISDMKAYDVVNEILKSQSINGRHILEELKIMGEKEPKVVSMKRLEQISSYKSYGYMKKKWQQYTRVHKSVSEDWESVMKRILVFISPIWKALCEDEIFFDDWMPELERFLS